MYLAKTLFNMYSRAVHIGYDIYQKINFVNIFTNTVVAIVILIMAVTLNGEWVVISAHIMRQYGIPVREVNHTTLDEAFHGLYLKNFRSVWIRTQLSAFGIYVIAACFLHWYYYVRQKDTPETWKCQPKTWLSREQEIDEIKNGILCLLVLNTWSALVACYIENEGKYSTVYYKWDEYGWIWLLLQLPVVYLYHDFVAYWMHRFLHMPYFFKRFHSLHHRYKQPTAFSTTAVHPVELSSIQILVAVPLFTVPVHWLPFSLAMIILYANGIISHSGIDFKFRYWMPFLAPAIFHDNHHQYYHVNFGINSKLWDKIFGTYRRPDRVYNKDIYYGRGKPIDELTMEEIKTEIEERENEIPRSFEEDNDPAILVYLKSKIK
ncbi:lathosterol oxidase-like [Planococcus citri]|uniref:lathosterol oxidase-like n=1 Tax=Planococcus citri TaxID=170843 RepID=UPI0031F89A97